MTPVGPMDPRNWPKEAEEMGSGNQTERSIKFGSAAGSGMDDGVSKDERETRGREEPSGNWIQRPEIYQVRVCSWLLDGQLSKRETGGREEPGGSERMEGRGTDRDLKVHGQRLSDD